MNKHNKRGYIYSFKVRHLEYVINYSFIRIYVIYIICNVVNYVKFFYLDRQRQDRAQATFLKLKLDIVRDSLRAARKILLFLIVFLAVFFFFFVSSLTPAWKAPPKRSLCYHRTQRGSQASHRGHHPAGMASKTNHVLQHINFNCCHDAALMLNIWRTYLVEIAMLCV